MTPRREGHEYSADFDSGEFYIVTNKDAENFKVVRAPASDPSEKNWKDFIPYNPDIKISDIGYAEDATERTTSAMWLDNGKPAVQLDLRRASGENTIKVTEAVKQKLKGVTQALPKGVTLTLISDDS